MGLLSERCARAAAAAAGVYERPDKTSYDGEWVGDRFEGHGPPSQSPAPNPTPPRHPRRRGPTTRAEISALWHLLGLQRL